MLKKMGFGLCLLILASFASGGFPQTFERPWDTDYEWGEGADTVDYFLSPALPAAWDERTLHKSLTGLNFSELDPRLETNETQAAKRGYAEAEWARVRMEEYAAYGLLPYAMDVGKTCGAFGIANCTCYENAGAEGCASSWYGDARYNIAKRLFSGNYSNGWKGGMNGALDALGERAGELNKETLSLATKYDAADFCGACGADVEGHEACENASLLFSALDGNGGAEFADFEFIREGLERDAQNVDGAVPEIAFAELMNAMGNNRSGAIAKAIGLETQVETQLNKTKRVHDVLSNETDFALAGAEAESGKAASEGLELVRASPMFGDVVGSGQAGVGLNVEAGNEKLAAAKGNRSAARFANSYQREGYLRESIILLQQSKYLAAQASADFASAEGDAETVALDYEKRARDALAKVEQKFAAGGRTEQGAALYAAAEKEIAAGTRETRVGFRFQNFALALKYAKQAYETTPESERSANWTSSGSCAYARAVLEGAKRDGVDVFYEEAELAALELNANASGLLAGCAQIVDSASASARKKYSYLEGERAEDFRLIGLCGFDCDDVKAGLVEAERGFVSGGTVVYPDAIGNLKPLSGAYAAAKSQSIRSIMAQMGKYLDVRPEFFAERASLDRPSLSRLEVSVRNGVNYTAQNVRADAESPVGFYAQDAVLGGDNLRGAAYTNGKMALYISKLEPSGTARFVFEKNTTVLRTVAGTISVKADAYEDGSARVEEARSVDAASDLFGFYTPAAWERVSVDGSVVAISNAYAASFVSEGRHQLKASYSAAGAYTQETYANSTNAVGARTYSKYQVAITPSMDLDSVRFFAPLPESTLLGGVQAISMSGEKVGSAAVPGGLLVSVGKVLAGRAAKVEISYYLDNSSVYAAGEIIRLRGQNISDEALAIVRDAELALARNDTATAIGRLGDANEQIRKDAAAAAKLDSQASAITRSVNLELKEINEALSSGLEANSLTQKLISRRDFINALLANASAKVGQERLLTLEKYDDGWIPALLRDFRKNASAETGRMETGYLDCGVENLEFTGQLPEIRALSNKFEASNSLPDAYALASSLAGLGETYGSMMAKLAQEKAAAASELGDLADGMSKTLAQYKVERAEASGTRFAGFFEVDEAGAAALLRDADAAMKRGNGSAMAELAVKVSAVQENASGTLDYLEGLAARNAEGAKAMVSSSAGRLGEKEYKKAAELAASLDGYAEDGARVKSLKASDEMMKIVSAAGSGVNYDAILMLSVIFVIGVVGLYYYKGRGGGKAQQKILRKLEKAA